jgi:hypothetical protein
MADTVDKAPAGEAFKAILEPLSDVALAAAGRFQAAGVGVLSVFRVEITGAFRFSEADGKLVTLLDTDERGTRPASITFQVDGLPPKPTLGETK